MNLYKRLKPDIKEELESLSRSSLSKISCKAYIVINHLQSTDNLGDIKLDHFIYLMSISKLDTHTYNLRLIFNM